MKPGLSGAGTIVLPEVKKRDDCLPCWERLDRLGWASGLAFVSHGARIGIRVNDPALLERIAKLLPPGSKPADSPRVDSLYSFKTALPGASRNVRRFHLLYQGIGQLARTHDMEEALAVLESDLHTQVALRSPKRLFVHAGVVGWKGRAIVLPGRSFSGKTTLTAALIQAGATYYSDEYAVFDAQGQVSPYLKTLSLRDADGAPARKCAAEDLGGRSGGPPLPVGLIALMQYQAGGRFRPCLMTPGQALMALLDNTVAARERPEQSLKTLSAVVRAPALKSRRGEAETAASALLAHPAFAEVNSLGK